MAAQPFPPGFLWGAATASHQVEGFNQLNDWWDAEECGSVPHRSGAACDQFRRYALDFKMAAGWGHNAHRFSLEWSRIEPEEGRWDEAALDHYGQVIRSLRENGLEPLVTLNHFTLPLWLARKGGWRLADSVPLFARFAARVAARLGNDIRFWLTINEPTVYVKRGYVAGSWPPHHRRALFAGSIAMRNLLRAHAAAYVQIRELRPQALVGFAHSAPYVAPHDPSSLADRFVSANRRFVLNHSWARLMPRVAGRLPLDFIGLNYYARELVQWRARGLQWLTGYEPDVDHEGRPRVRSSLGWEIHADGLAAVVEEFSRYRVPIYITENGIATQDEAQRSEYLVSHLHSLARAVARGVDVRGYFCWSLLDNFEWAEGYAARFGLAHVDFPTQLRTPRPAAETYARICRSNGESLLKDQRG
jgi:beta-glucosidase